MTTEELLGHLRDGHGTRLEELDLLTPLEDVPALVHAAMHNGRAYVGHFHRDGEVLDLWDSEGRIQQVDTRGRV